MPGGGPYGDPFHVTPQSGVHRKAGVQPASGQQADQPFGRYRARAGKGTGSQQFSVRLYGQSPAGTGRADQWTKLEVSIQ